jgi:hypothetical protein
MATKIAEQAFKVQRMNAIVVTRPCPGQTWSDA